MVLHRAKKSLCNRLQFRMLFLPHRFIKIVLPISDPSALDFSQFVGFQNSTGVIGSTDHKIISINYDVPPPPQWNSHRNSFENEDFSTKTSNPLKGVEPFESILRALFRSQCPYKFFSFLDLRTAFNRFRLFSRDFWLFRFIFPGSACFSSLASARNLPSWVKYHGKFESFGKEFRWTKFIVVERV